MIDARLFHILVDSFGKILLPGLMMTIPLTAISFTLALCIAVITALVQLYIIFYGLPRLGIVIDPFPAAVIVFSINEGAYAAEIMRAALESIPSLSNSLIAMIKDTSLAANITVTGFIYLMFSTVLTKLQRMGEKKMNSQGKQREIPVSGRKIFG